MLGRFAASVLLVGVTSLVWLQSEATAQRAQRPRFPMRQQFAESAEAQRRVAAARALAKADLLPEFENTCSSTGPQRVATAREEAGLPPPPKEVLPPTRIFDNLWFVGPNNQGRTW